MIIKNCFEDKTIPKYLFEFKASSIISSVSLGEIFIVFLQNAQKSLFDKESLELIF